MRLFDSFRQARFEVHATLLVLVLVATACGQVSTEVTTPDQSPEMPTPSLGTVSEPTPVIVDYSPTVSDVGGLMYLLAHPGVDVIAVTLPGTGEAGCDLGIDVTLGILAMFDRNDIPVACDAVVPSHARQWPAEFLQGHEQLAFELPPASAVPAVELPSDLIARTASDTTRPVVIYAVAPLTNVARALADHPDLTDHIGSVVVMGGAVEVSGNVFGTDAEWNVWIDVPAAAAVMSSGVPVTLVPLDATNDVPVPGGYREMLREVDQSDAVVYLSRLVDTFPSVTSGFYYLWDELAAAVVAGEQVTDFETMTISAIDGGPDDGQTVVSSNGEEITVAINVDNPDGFYSNFLSTLARNKP